MTQHVQVGVSMTGGKVVVGGQFLPGQHEDMPMATTIKNTGNTTETMTIHTVGDIVASPTTLTLKSGQSSATNVSVQVPFNSVQVGQQTGWLDVTASSSASKLVTAGANAQYNYTLGTPGLWLRLEIFTREHYPVLVGGLVLATVVAYAVKGVMAKRKKEQDSN